MLLVQPWVEDYYSTDCRIQPIGLAYLAGSVARRFDDVDVQIYDALAGGKKRTIRWPREFDYLRRYYGSPDKGPFRLFHAYSRFGDSDDEVVERLRDYRPFLIGISALFSPYYRESLAMAAICRRLFPGVPIVMGGSHASLRPDTLLRPDGADYVLRGEGEESLCELIELLRGERAREDVRELIERGDPIETPLPPPVSPPRQNLPRPRFPGLDPDDYTYDGRRLAFVVASRSCPHRCSFCSIHSVFGYAYETRTVDDIVQEIEDRYRDGYRHFDFEDDNFTFRRAHTIELLRRIAALGRPIRLSAMNGISYISLDDEVLEWMERAGFETLNIALVSSDQMVLRFTERPHTVERFEAVVRSAVRVGLRVTAYLILGMPGQSIAEMVGTLRRLAASQCLVGASPFYFTPGSPIHVEREGDPCVRLASANRDPCFSARLSALDVETDDFDRDDVYTCFRLTRLVNHVKKGLDEGLDTDDPFFEPARRALRDAEWFAETKDARNSLPFSRRVAAELAREPLTVRGFRTPRTTELETAAVEPARRS